MHIDEKIRSMPIVFTVDSVNPRHICHRDDKNKLKIYLESIFVEVRSYMIIELRPDKGVFIFISKEITNLGLIHDHPVEMEFEVAAGPNGLATTIESEAIDFMIAYAIKEIVRYENYDYDVKFMKERLRAILGSSSEIPDAG